jgi:hypothetical protein
MGPPRLDALQMLFVQIAWPPRDGRKVTSEIDHVLAGAAAGLDCIAGFASDESPQHGADRLVIAVKGRRVKPAVGFGTTTVLSEFDDIVDHGSASTR